VIANIVGVALVGAAVWVVVVFVLLTLDELL